MIRSAMAVLALVILSGFAVAAGPLEAQETRTHEVVRGETLWGIAQQYYNNPRLWPRIYEANRDRVEDPDLIEIGLVLTIPSGDAAAVGAVTVMTPDEPVAAEMEPAPRQAPQQAPRPRRRTVFFPDTANPTLIADSGPALTAVSPDVVYSAPWLIPDDATPGHTGRILGFAGAEGGASPRESALPHDRMLVTFEGPTPAVGALLQVFRVDHDVEELGSVVVPTGVLRVESIQSAGAVASVEKLYGRMSVENLVGPIPPYPLEPGQRAQDVSGGQPAEILGFANSRPVYSLGDVVFLDKGSVDGVSIGDEYELVFSATEGWEGEVEGTLQVIALKPDHASARIVGEKSPAFRRGGEVLLVRKMR